MLDAVAVQGTSGQYVTSQDLADVLHEVLHENIRADSGDQAESDSGIRSQSSRDNRSSKAGTSSGISSRSTWRKRKAVPPEFTEEDKQLFGEAEIMPQPEISPVVENLGAVVDAEESRADEIAGDRRDDRIADLQKSVDQLSSQALATTVKSNAEKIKVVSDKCDSMSASLGSGAGTARFGLENVCTDGSSVRTTPQRTIEVPSTSGARSVVSQTPSLTDDRRNTDTEVVDSLVSSEFLKPPKFTRCYKLGETSQWTFSIDKFISELVTRGCRAIDKQLNLLCPVSESVEHVIRDTLIQHIENATMCKYSTWISRHATSIEKTESCGSSERRRYNRTGDLQSEIRS
ncbi:hypothetical protein QAD02_018015 [Eretmocerus hayati]|uniref:Uncharacterized protein n=1 Tax=Eretmocerus hayati TaxID=131215 RepID=A0ACC2PFK7_9HYME|nr:hypothetical protein QAD02_018015 [Eretmocerus hayati]